MNRSWSFSSLRIATLALLLSGLAVADVGAADLSLQVDSKAVGEIVAISGQGFQPSEMVRIRVAQLSESGERATEYADWDILADASGNLSTAWMIASDEQAGQPISVVAEGYESGLLAAASSIEVDSRVTITDAPASIIAGEPFDVTILLEQNCCDGIFAPLAYRTVSFYAHTGDCGIDIAIPPLATTTTDANGYATATLTIDDVDGYIIGVKYDGEPEPGALDDPNSACDPESKVTILASIDCRSITLLYPPPEISCATESIFACQDGSYCFPTTILEPGAGDLVFSIPMGSSATIDPVTGELCLMPDISAIYEIEVTATDSTGNSGSCTAVITVEMNTPPELSLGADTTVRLCAPIEICMPVDLFDIDGNIVEVTTSKGTYADGQVCFVPYSLGVHEIEVTAIDECGQSSSDIVVVTVTTSDLSSIVCPDDATVFGCAADTFCFPIEGIPEGDGITVEVTGVNTWWDAENQTVCFFSECSYTNHITLTVSDDCGEYTCEFSVTVECNRPPVVILPPDTVMWLCEVGELCVPVGISDPDGNLSSVSVDGGTYDAARGLVCVDPATSGVHVITVTAIDDCGEETIDQITIEAHIGEDPQCEFPDGYELTFEQCAPGQVLVPVRTNDPSATCSVFDGPGEILDGYWTYTPTESGTVAVTIRCLNTCGDYCEDTFWVTFVLNESPMVACAPIEERTLCDLNEICLPGFSAVDGDSDYLMVTATINGVTTTIFESSDGSDWSGDICFTPIEGRNDIAIAAIDDCGRQAACETYLDVILNGAPVCSGPTDTSLYLCESVEICLPLDVTDPEGGLLGYELIAGPGAIVEGDWCYTPTEGGIFEVTVRATDECGASCDQTFAVTLDVNEPPMAICPTVDPISLCELSQEICIDGFYASDPETPDVSAEINGIPLVGSSFCFYPVEGVNVLTLIVTDECGLADTCTTEVVVNANRLPTCSGPSDTTIVACEGETVCLPLFVDDPDGNFDQWQITYGGGYIDGDQWCYVADVPRVQDITIWAVDSCNAHCELSFTVTFEVNQLPEVSDRYTSVHLCDPGDMRQVGVAYHDPDGDPLIFEILSGEGTIDGNGLITYYPMAEGVYTFEVSAADDCGADTGFVYDTVTINDPPVLITTDSTIYLCELEEICFDVIASDADGETIEIYQQLGPGWFQMLTDTSGQTCFMPDDVDSATYVFGYCAIDACDYIKSGIEPPTCPPCEPDTVRITVIIDRPPVLTCPDEQIFSTCEPATFCFDVSADDPENGALSFELVGSYDNVTIDGSTVCVAADESMSFNIMIAVFDICGHSDTCTVPVTIEGNNPPTVEMADDFAVTLCEPEEICFDATVGDVDGGLIDTLLNLGIFDGSRICFWADTAGVYEITLAVTDDCDVTVEATTRITVAFEEAPVVDLGDDFSTELCETAEICVDVAIAGDYESVISNLGLYNPSTGQVCFIPESSGTHNLVVTASGLCGSSSDTVAITVELNSPPEVSDMADTSVFLCFPAEICLPVTIFDPDGNIATIVVSQGTYADGQVCFVPYESGIFEIIVTVTDSCGLTATSSATVTVDTDEGIDFVCPNDTSLFVCAADTICLPLEGIPEGAEVIVVGVNTWYDELTQTICFFTECGITNDISVEVTTECGVYTCEFTVTIYCNLPPLALLPPDTNISLCEPADICIPVAVSDPDGNLMEVTIDGYQFLEYDELTSTICFYGQMSGDYTIIVNAIDSCGEVDSDTMVVHLWANTPPYISFCCDTVLTVCESEVCVPIDIYDGDGEETLVEIFTDFGYYNWETGELCFTADSSGHYCIMVTAIDSCGASYSAEACVTVELMDNIYIDCPTDMFEPLPMCEPGEICVPIVVVGENYTVTTDQGTWVDGQLCFYADQSAIYVIQVVAEGACNTDICEVEVRVEISDSDLITCPGDTAVILCEADTICFDYDVSASVTQIRVSAPAYFDGEQVCVPILQAGNLEVEMIATSDCGEDTCYFTVASSFNTPPTVTLGNDTTIVACDLVQVCFPFTIIDIEDNVVSIIASNGATIVDNSVCFTPPQAGTYTITVTATDECGAVASDEIEVTFDTGDDLLVICSQTTEYASLCAADSVCFTGKLLVTPGDAQIEILPGGSFDPLTGRLCIWADSTGLYEITINVSTVCHDTTVGFDLVVTLGEEPTLECPQQIDSLMCLIGDTTLCFEVSLTGTDVDITINPMGTYDNGWVCIPVDTAGTYEVEIIASNDCGVDTCYTTVVIEGDVGPFIILPAHYLQFERCPDDSEAICIDDIVAGDTVGQGILSFEQTCGPGDFTLITNDSGVFCLPVDIQPGLYDVCFEVWDGCYAAYDTLVIEIIDPGDCDVCMTISIDGGECIPVGVQHQVAVNIETDMYIGGFDLLMSFDASVMAFVRMDPGPALGGDSDPGRWEYLDHRLNSAGCGSGCPSGLIRVVGIADINNGPSHPDHDLLSPNGTMFYLTFQIANDQNLGDQFLPLRFMTYDCGDNAVSDTTGNELYVDLRIWGPEAYLIWDETDDVNFPEASRPFGIGTADECFGLGKVDPIRCIEFINDGICILHPDSIDDRGDVNLNGVPYEIADAVLFSNYFVYGLGVFTVNVAGQIAATDVNADGITLSVADLVLLIRVVIGDADPVPKLAPYDEVMAITTDQGVDQFTIATEAVSDIGAGLFVYDIPSDVSLGEPVLAAGVDDMDLLWTVENGQLRMLIWSMGPTRIEAGFNELIQIPYTGSGSITLNQSEIVDYYGRPYESTAKGAALPTDFALGQNYPNPFNPSTTIGFSLPVASDWNLSIYNIKGELVTRFDGSAAAGNHEITWDGSNDGGGPVASGIYFYRLEAETFSETRKMVLLK